MTTKPQNPERVRLLLIIQALQTELSKVSEELTQARARISAYHKYTFTLHFTTGQVALLEVHDAANHEQALALARTALKHAEYTVSDGDQTQGHAHTFSYWCNDGGREQES